MASPSTVAHTRSYQDQTAVQHHDKQRLQSILAEKSWFGFDLDDTLHDFRGASSTATKSTLAAISQRHAISLPILQDHYAKVLREKTANAFSDGRTSFDYRKERFVSVLAYFSLPLDEQFLGQLLELYETTLSSSLCLKPGALSLLTMLKREGKSIVVITEGPQDAQERTISHLGLAPYIDCLITTNHFGVTKLDGLFTKVLEHLRITSKDMAYIGDSEVRDMEPAMAIGIFSIHLAETKPSLLAALPLQINTLVDLEGILKIDEQV
ncbi:hypothetical protein PT974_04569 [Cladobotryum mycophilum]|uniref:Uncharacterized protein n=1 Tax=Cladobotryum mycophilum TaxID=491253 RepID=A0ABR0SWN4_9HYPO